MSAKNGIYKCNICGNIVEKIIVGGGTLVCCGQDMELLVEKEADGASEKHVPFITELDDGYKVTIGENTIHPMTEEHFIRWIEIIVDNKVYRQELKPGDAPEAVFVVGKGKVIAREYCNLHGHWKSEK